jgi:hypothetical protein
MSFGVAFVQALPTPGVTASPQFESDLIAWCQEAEAKLEQKVVNSDTAFTGAGPTHGEKTIGLSASKGAPLGATWDAANQYFNSAAGADTVTIGLDLEVGQRIKAVSLHGRANGTNAWTLDLLSIAAGTGAVTNLGTVTSATPAAIEKKSIGSLSVTVAADIAYVLRWTAGGAGNRCIRGEVVVDRP